MLAVFGIGQTELLIVGLICLLFFGNMLATIVGVLLIVRAAKRIPCPHCGRLGPGGAFCNWCGEAINPPIK